MDTVLTARAALIQALFEGPGYGLALVRRVKEKTGGGVKVGRGNLYGALKALARDGMVRSWGVVPGKRRGGRRRIYYELTTRGIERAEAERAALLGLVGTRSPAPSPEQAARMQSRLEDCAELSADVLELRDAMRRAR